MAGSLVGGADRAGAEVAAGHAHPQQLADLEVGRVADDRAVGPLDDGVTAVERRLRRQRAHLGAQVRRVVTRPVQLPLDPAPGPVAQGLDDVALAAHERALVGEHRPAAQLDEAAPLVVQPPGRAPDASGRGPR